MEVDETMEQSTTSKDDRASGKTTPEPAAEHLSDNETAVDMEKQSMDNSAAVPEPRDDTLVEFSGANDPDNPKNWSPTRRSCITVSMSSMTFVVTFSSSIFAVAIEPVAEEYNIGTVTAALGVALFLLVWPCTFSTRLPSLKNHRASSWDQFSSAPQAKCTAAKSLSSQATLPLRSSRFL